MFWLVLAGGCDGPDADDDGWGAPADCADADPDRHPGAVERCDGLDDDCDGVPDNLDADRDGAIAAACGGPDCDDTNPDVGAGVPRFVDADGDGWAGTPTDGCGAALAADDCDDQASDVHPGALEVCDGVDQDCDGLVDTFASDRALLFRDADGDGYGDLADAVLACAPQVGRVTDQTDCDDAVASTHPGSPEACGNGADDDCDGLAPDCGVFTVGSVAEVDVTVLLDGDVPDLTQLLSVGDVDGDGSDDLMASYNDGVAVLRGPFNNPTVDLGVPFSLHDFGLARVGGTTHFDGDGELDLVVAAPSDGPLDQADFESAWILFGPGWRAPGVFDIRFDPAVAARAATWYGPGNQGVGASLGLPGDVDEDGLDDLLIGGDQLFGVDGSAWLVRGGSIARGQSLPLDEATPMLSGSYEDELGAAVGAPGDLDGDGIGDLAIAAPTDDRAAHDGGVVHLVYGGAAELAPPELVPAATLALPVSDGWFGVVLVSPGDTDGDGYPELAVTNICFHDCPGGLLSAEIRLFGGGPRLAGEVDASVAADALLYGVASDHAYLASAAGDLDGDGTGDLVTGSAYFTSVPGLWLLPGPFAGTTAFGSVPGAAFLPSDVDEVRASGVGDLDGDGASDLAIWNPFVSSFGPVPSAGILWGGPGW